MSQSMNRHVARFGVVLLLASLAATAITLETTEAQVPVYRVEGIVYGPSFQPLKDAAVTLFTAAGAKAGSATTDAAGKYSIASLQSGNYNLTVSAACCPSAAVPVQVAGTDPVVQQNIVLGGAQGQGPLSLKGVAKDEASGKPLANVQIEMWNYPQPSGNMSYSSYRENRQSTVTGTDGTFSFNVEAGSINLNARLEGYDHLHANFPMQASRSVDLPMKAASGSAVTIQGVVKGSDGKPLPNAWVHVQPDYECDGDVCTAVAYPREHRSGANGDVSYWYEPANSPYQSASTDANGKYKLTTAAGRLIVQAYADQHIESRSKVTAAEGETKTVDHVLEKMPADSVLVTGTVVDAATGKPVAYAYVNLENQRWGHWNSTMSKEDGSFEFRTKPGYTVVTVTAEQHYWVPCTYEAQSKDRAIAPGEPYPCADGGQRTRDQSYFSRVFTFQGTDAGQELDARLQPRPAANAELKGYVLNATDKKALSGVQVHFYNEFTRDWGTATTDADGSFKIKVHEGYYTIRAFEEHYFDGVVNTQVKAGESKRVDVELTPGEKRYGGGGCCYAVAESSAKHAGSGAAMQTSYASPDMASGESPMSGEGSASYKGEGGGLGPYRPASNEQSGGTSPGAGIGVLVAGVLAVALLRRRNL